MLANSLEYWRDFCYYQHDVECNQKYADTLPYSTHLGFVVAQSTNFMRLIEPRDRLVVSLGLFGHDLMEDARLSYNNVVEECRKHTGITYDLAERVADIIYCVTDEKGKNRKERKSDKYYEELKQDELAVFVKLCDIAANTLFSKLSGSDMYRKYKKEFPVLKEKIYLKKYDELFTYIENL